MPDRDDASELGKSSWSESASEASSRESRPGKGFWTSEKLEEGGGMAARGVGSDASSVRAS